MKTYIFHVSIPGTGRVWRKIEIGADQTLEQLHIAIQGAFGFGRGHLYSFFMSGRAWDKSTEYCLPEGHSPDSYPEPSSRTAKIKKKVLPFPQQEKSKPKKHEVSPMFEDLLKEMIGDVPNVVEIARSRLGDDKKWNSLMGIFAEPGNVKTMVIEELELKQGQQFLYLYDYGSEWRFKVRVHAIKTDSPNDVKYPRIVERVGKYPS